MDVKTAAWMVGLIAWFGTPGYAADLCDPNAPGGPYGFLLSGDTTITGETKPAASVGRVVFDGSGKLSGYSSVNFAGWFLGNPVTGTYEAQRDCSLTWSLQDDSGNLQHFRGTISTDGKRVQFSQTDRGGAQQGQMVRTADQCAAPDVAGRYRYTIGGAATNMDTGKALGKVGQTGVLMVRQDGQFEAVPDAGGKSPLTGSLHLEDGCFVQLDTAERHYRGILVDEGRELLGIATDPAMVITLRLRRLP